MKHVFKYALFMSVVGLAACNKGGSSADQSGNPPPPAAKVSPDYKSSAIAGKVAGTAWTAARAGAHHDPQSGGEVVRIFADAADVCAADAMSTLPMVSVILPSLSEAKEFVTDSSINQFIAPVTFTDLRPSPPTNDVADFSKVVASKIGAGGFQLALYGRASITGRESEINGTVSVVNCDTQVDFSKWRALEGTYTVQSYDDQEVPSHPVANVEFNSSDMTTSTGQAVSMVQFPLIYSIADSTTASWNFGPMQGLGTSQINGTTEIYDYQGPLVNSGQSYNVNLHLEVQTGADNTTLSVLYHLDISGVVTPSNHHFVLRKFAKGDGPA